MLMEHSAETSHGTSNAKEIRSSDLQKTYSNGPKLLGSTRKNGGVESRGTRAVKRKHNSEDNKGVAKRSKKEALLSSLSSGGKSEKGASEVVGDRSSLYTESGVDKKDNVGSSLGGISLNLYSNVSIPKRPRDLVRRKKVELAVRSKQDGRLSSKPNTTEGVGKSNGSTNGDLLYESTATGKLAQNGEPDGGADDGFLVEAKGKKNSGNHRKNRASGSDLLRHLKREGSGSSVHNRSSLTKKAKRSRKKTKISGSATPSVATESKQVLDESSGVCDDSQDDEENLEANAARMLSSRFDPSCTGFSLGGKSPGLPSTNDISALVSSSEGFAAVDEPVSRAESDVASSDTENRMLQPREHQKGKGIHRKRRCFYELLSRELDSYWMLNQRIKVFWPLDRKWYFGHVIGYDPEKKLHHIKYDDRDEEWIDLQNERFMLLLLPSEVPGKGGRNKRVPHDNSAKNGKHGETTDNEGNSNSFMDSQPIISWLAHAAHHRSPSSGVRKKGKPVNNSAKSQLSSFSDGKTVARGGVEVGSSGKNADDLACNSAQPENLGDSMRDGNSITENFISHSKPPIVYFRRRFHRKKQSPGLIYGEDLCQLPRMVAACGTALEFIDSPGVDADMLEYMDKCGHTVEALSRDELIWNTDDSGHLKLNVPVTSLQFKFEWNFPLPGVINKLFGEQRFLFNLHHGSLISVWPVVHLEMLFVDNIDGFRFLLFEGCLKQAVFIIFLVMAVFYQANHNKKHSVQQLPVTSLRFRLSGLHDLQKQLVYMFYNFNEIASSKWSYLDRKLKSHCVFTKQLPPSECTYDNIKALYNDSSQLSLTCVPRQTSSIVSLWKKSRQHKMKISAKHSARLNLGRLTWDSNKKHGKLPAFALSFAAAPTFFLSLHLKLLMERSIPSCTFGEQDPVSVMDTSEITSDLFSIDQFLHEDSPIGSSFSVRSNALLRGNKIGISAELTDEASIKPTHKHPDSPEDGTDLEKGKAYLTGTDHAVLSAEHVDPSDQLPPVKASLRSGPRNGITVEIPSCESIKKDAVVSCPIRTATRSLFHRNGVGNSSASANSSPAWSDGKQDFPHNGFGNGPKKPRTQVSYSLPLGGHDHNLKNKFQHTKGFSHKRIRRASEKKTLDAFGTSQKNMESLCCESNVLVTVGDRGWREWGAKVTLELVDHTEWRLVVKISGDTKYSYKAHQFVQPGTTNRFTHAMMWKGGKDWILEFLDRSQWTLFKEMHEECYNRNFRAASVKNIPIPGVRLVEDNDDTVPEVPFVRSSPKYYRQVDTDVDVAMDPSRILYDMDSDDEHWIAKYRGFDSSKSNCEDFSDEMFEKAMDVFEKVAYAKQCDHFSPEELEEDMAGLGPVEMIKVFYEHWHEKRQRKGMPLLRHLQPPLWENYQQQVKEWEQAMLKYNAASSNGCQEKPSMIEKPPMYAFCLKPRGLEVSNRGSKQRCQKKLSVSALGNVISADSDAFHAIGRRWNGYALGDERVVYAPYGQGLSDTSPVLQGSTRVFSPRDAGGVTYFSLSGDGSGRSHYPKLYRNRSKKLSFIQASNDNQAFASCSHRNIAKRTGIHGGNMSSSEWLSQMHNPPDVMRRHNFEQLDPSERDEFKLRDAASAARHAVTIARIKRENSQRMLCRADLAMHKAVSAIMTAEAIMATHKEPNGDI